MPERLRAPLCRRPTRANDGARRPGRNGLRLALLVFTLLSLQCAHHRPVRHRVRRGDTLYQVARRYGVSVEALVRANRLSKGRQIYPGQWLLIPGRRLAQRAAPRHLEPDPDAAKAPKSRPVMRAEVFGDCGGAKTQAASRPKGDGFHWPVDGVVVSKFGRREGLRHDGIDIAAPEGTVIRAASPGRVIYVGEQSGYGRLVIVAHEGEWVTVYAHNRENCVADGEDVAPGDVLALVGRSGGANAPFLHFELRKSGRPVNPARRLGR